MVNEARRKAYRFGSFTLDLEREALLAADGQEIALRPKSFALLRLLVEHAGRLVSKEEIMEVLWPNIYVTENNITQCIHEIRRALGPEAQQTLRTRPRRGYLFTSDITPASPSGLFPHADPSCGSGVTCHAPPGSTKHPTDEERFADCKAVGRAGRFDATEVTKIQLEILSQQLDAIRCSVRLQDSGAVESLNG